MCPQIQFLGMSISLYYPMQAIGFVSIFLFGLRWNYGKKGPHLPISPLIMLCVLIPAFLGGRILYATLYSCSSGIGDVFDFSRGGSMFFGALLGGVLGFVAYMENRQIPILLGLDVFAPYIPLGASFGCLGCFLFGCCWGIPSQVPWAVQFPEGSPAYNLHLKLNAITLGETHSLPVHPTQLYGAVIYLFLCGFLILVRQNVKKPGYMFFLFVLSYMAIRFFLDFLRADHPVIGLGLTSIQWGAITVISGIAIAYLVTNRREKKSILCSGTPHAEQGQHTT